MVKRLIPIIFIVTFLSFTACSREADRPVSGSDPAVEPATAPAAAEKAPVKAQVT
ncbi:hypothetical protein J5834_04715 [bacterium]|nr:hypothetical protein [bacterium]